jgi:hypothetical protein
VKEQQGRVMLPGPVILQLSREILLLNRRHLDSDEVGRAYGYPAPYADSGPSSAWGPFVQVLGNFVSVF